MTLYQSATRCQAPPTLGEFATSKLQDLCRGLRLPPYDANLAISLFDRMSSSWADQPLAAAPGWPSDISDDGTPCEFSVAFGERAPKLRMLLEAQQPPWTLHSNWAAGLRLNSELSCIPGFSLDRFDRIADVFAPTASSKSYFAVWHAAEIDQGEVQVKAYLNPGIHGARWAPALTAEALSRLGFGSSNDAVARLCTMNPQNALAFLSLDLSRARGARIKVYVAHRAASIAEIDAQLSPLDGYCSGDALSWLSTLTDHAGPFSARPILSCLAFKEPHTEPSVTLHVPIRCYSSNDADTLDRVCRLLNEADRRKARNALASYARRPLDSGRGLIAYVSLRRVNQALRVTLYLSLETYMGGHSQHCSLESQP